MLTIEMVTTLTHKKIANSQYFMQRRACSQLNSLEYRYARPTREISDLLWDVIKDLQGSFIKTVLKGGVELMTLF
jgi:hypothetical protein